MSSQSSHTFDDLRKALIDRYGKRPHESPNDQHANYMYICISTPFFKTSMDILGPLAKTNKGNRIILTIVDDAMRYPEKL